MIKAVGTEKQRSGLERRVIMHKGVPFITEDLSEARQLRREFMARMGSETIKYKIVELKDVDTYL